MRAAGNFCTCPTPCTDTNLVPSLSFSSISVDTDTGGAAQQKRVEDLMTSEHRTLLWMEWKDVKKASPTSDWASSSRASRTPWSRA